ncbi:class I SAM-dependent methyltransferase [Flavobacterium sp.]|uniref:class I SAM-dependent methyltransferase n=1 Tax=Flavobacterium sp. TaxID=239 RepID=UPI002607FCDA|nr:class I SAM-dependent methyltransferase [Flavobacterium sp.]
MKIDNKSFWEKSTIIATQEVLQQASDFELYLFDEAKKRTPSTIQNIKIFGCGTGREIHPAATFFNPQYILASDISENMILKCQENLEKWGIAAITETVVADAVVLNQPRESFQLVTLLNSMLTYVPQHESRLQIMRNAHELLVPGGQFIGVVHHQIGSPMKTVYFRLRSLFRPFLGVKVGNRMTGFNGFQVPGYYYAVADLKKDLLVSGFKEVVILSLEEFYHQKGQPYNRKTGYNNLIFIATKPE